MTEVVGLPAGMLFESKIASASEAVELGLERERDRMMLPLVVRFTELLDVELRSAMADLVERVLRLPGPLLIVSLMRGGVAVGAVLAEACRGAGAAVAHEPLGWIRGESAPLGTRIPAAGAASVVVVDGWTGSGDSIREIRRRWDGGEMVTAALADPAEVCDLSGTLVDMLCPHALLTTSIAWGYGRARRGSDGVLYAPQASCSDSVMDWYCASIAPAGRIGFGTEREASPRMASSAALDGGRDSLAVGINECWRAMARGELAELAVSAEHFTDEEIRQLIAKLGKAVVVEDIGRYRCVGRVAFRGSGLGREVAMSTEMSRRGGEQLGSRLAVATG